MIITRTPYRLSFFGGGTDYNPWFEKHKGTVLAVGLEYYCYLTVRYLPPFFSEHLSRIVYSKIESVSKNNLYNGSVDFKPFYLNANFNYEGLSSKNLFNK